MDEEEYNAFLLQKADEVDDLVQDDNVKKVFQDHTRVAFAQNHLRGKHLEALRCSNPDPALPQLCDDEKLTLEYFLLTLIHDFAPGDVPTTRFIYFDSKCNDEEYMWAYAEYCLWTSSYTEDHEAGGKIRHNISRALEHIKAETKVKPTSDGKAGDTNSKTGNEKVSSIYIDKFDNRGGSTTFGEKSPIDNSKVTNPSPKEKEPLYKKLYVFLGIVVLVITVLSFFDIKQYTDFFNRKPSSSPTTQHDTPPVIKSPIDPNIVDINKPISKLPKG